jgi:hypothetical protein
MGLAAVNMLVFHFGTCRRVALWNSGEPPYSAKVAGALSLLIWTAVVFFGRWIGFTMRQRLHVSQRSPGGAVVEASRDTKNKV